MDISTDDFPTPYYSHETFLTNSVFKAAMNRKWNEVLEHFRDNKEVQCKKITRSGDTVLHLAISGATQRIVLQLVEIIKSTNTEDERHDILGAKNKDGDTPLHLAAALGLGHICYKIAQLMPQLVTRARNNDGETPLFTAVRHGKNYAFFALEATIDTMRDVSHCRNRDGDHILHQAIKGEHFDLAYEIMHLYPKLVNYVNTNGETALHILASKPSGFKSGTRLGFFDKILYYCTITEPLKLKFDDFMKNPEQYLSSKCSEVLPERDCISLPTTYKACIDLFSLTKDFINYTFKTVASSLTAPKRKRCCCDDPENRSASPKGDDERETSENQTQRRWIPHNYDVAVCFLKIIVKLLIFVVLGLVLRSQTPNGKRRQHHRNAKTIMKELVERSELWKYEDTRGGLDPQLPSISSLEGVPSVESNNHDSEENQQNPSKGRDRDTLKEVVEKLNTIIMEIENKSKNEPDIANKKKSTKRFDSAVSPVLIAAKMGITEMVERILEKFPVAILDKDEKEKNIALLAAEHRQVDIYNFVLESETMKERMLGKVDTEGNSALHLAAMLGKSHSWNMHGAALQMQLESNWYKYVLSRSVDTAQGVKFATINKEGKTAEEVFIATHDDLMEKGSDWLINTSQYCAVVTALIATVAFEAAGKVPEYIDLESGFEGLINKPAFLVYAISSILALCSSVASLILFLAILTSGYKAMYFDSGLPLKLILGLTSLYISIASMLVSLCTGNLFVVGKNLNFAIYAFMCPLVTFFAISTQPIYTVILFPLDFKATLVS